NCHSLCCLLASRLRQAGYGPEEVYVALGGWRNRLQYHAWLLLRREEDFLQIDPSTLAPEERTGARIWSQQTIHVLFNDRHVHVLEAEKLRLLVAPRSRVKPRKVLFGRFEPEIAKVLADRWFDAALAAWFAAAARP